MSLESLGNVQLTPEYFPQLKQSLEFALENLRQSDLMESDLTNTLALLTALVGVGIAVMKIRSRQNELKMEQLVIGGSKKYMREMANHIPLFGIKSIDSSGMSYVCPRTIQTRCLPLKNDIEKYPELKQVFVEVIIKAIDDLLKSHYASEVQVLGSDYSDTINVLTFFQNAARQEKSPGISIYDWLIDLSQEYVNSTASTTQLLSYLILDRQ